MPFMSDGLSTLYQDLLSGSYDCVDRIVLNAYFRMGHDPGGFRLWWRQLTGSDATLDNAHVMRLAGRFGRRIRGYAKANDIPVVNCSAGERKHDIAEDYLARTTITQTPAQYGPTRAAYDLKKFRGQQIVQRIGATRRYEARPAGLKAITALVVLRDKAIKPLLAAAQELRPRRGAHNPTPLDAHYDALRAAMRGVFHELGIAA